MDISSVLKPVYPDRLRAFTLVEMLVVIAIMSILMTAGAIGLSGMGGKGAGIGLQQADQHSFRESSALDCAQCRDRCDHR